MSATSDGLLESTDDPLALTIMGFALLVAGFLIYVALNRMDDSAHNSMIVMFMWFIVVTLMLSGVTALSHGLYGG